MAANEIHVGDIGTIFEITLKDEGNSPEIVDISTASTKDVVFKNPAGVSQTKTGAFTTDGTDGKLQYASEAGFLAGEGIWYIQAHIILGTASPKDAEWYSDIGSFECFPNL